MMRTLGLDLAAQKEATFACVLEWDADRVRVAHLAGALDDSEVHSLLDDATLAMSGVDVPFGWPDAFLDLMTHAGAFSSWHADAKRLRLRATDQWCQRVSGVCPLSVSSERLAAPAMRWRILRARCDVSTRPIREVYPAAALARWKLPHRRYKRPDQAAARREILSAIASAIGLDLGVHEPMLLASADPLDALVAALVARAIAIGAIGPVDDATRAGAAREDWIELPRGDLADLAARPPERA
jgi:hypothetical protein